MKTRNEMSFHGEPSKTTRRLGLTEWISANKDTVGRFSAAISANATVMFHIKFKSHKQMNLHDEFEEEEKLLMSMEDAAGIVV